MKSGIVFNIQKFSVNDGPGIRTTVFLKGCPLKCIWCHNPESQSIEKEMLFSKSKCVSCMLCLKKCPRGAHSVFNGEHIFDREKCVACGECTVCPTGALELAGEERTSDEIICEVLKDKVFYDNSGGGMTLSGGEPMFQFEFTRELLIKARENSIHTSLETCGFAPREHYLELLPYVDLFLFDYKETSPEKHREYTGVTNELILDNLKLISDNGGKIILRCPIIPGCNDRDEHFDGIADIANRTRGVTEINVEPYHPLGAGKSEMLGREYQLSGLGFPDEALVEKWIERISLKTEKPVKKA